MDDFELRMRKMLDSTQKLTLTEFYMEKVEIQDSIKNLVKVINGFGIYSPKYNLKFSDFSDMQDKLKTFLKQKLDALIVETDSRFSLENFSYVQEELGNQKIADIYNLLGPFNYENQKPDEDEKQKEEENSQRSM